MALFDGASKNQPLPKDIPFASVLEDVVEMVAGYAPFEINFEDLTGFTFDAPEFALDERWRAHCSDFCLFAKANQSQRRECVINKRLCNRKAKRGVGFSGMCHLGLTECVEPLRVAGKTLGVFYFGSVVIEGKEAIAEQRILQYCHRHQIPPEGHLQRLRETPKVTEAQWEKGMALFRRSVRLAAAFVENLGLPIESYKSYGIRTDATSARSIASLSRSAMAYVQKHYKQPCRLLTAAKALGCHPVHLGRIFKKDLGVDFNEFVHSVRIGHAKKLLRTHAMNATQVSYEVGYYDPSHFNRIFRRLVGMTPGEFAK